MSPEKSRVGFIIIAIHFGFGIIQTFPDLVKTSETYNYTVEAIIYVKMFSQR